MMFAGCQYWLRWDAMDSMCYDGVGYALFDMLLLRYARNVVLMAVLGG